MSKMRFYLVCFCVALVKLSFCFKDEVPTEPKSTALAHEYDDRLLLFSTLDGALINVDHLTGDVKWRIEDRPVVEVPTNSKDAVMPIFLPDPRDGSLYLLDNSREPLKKLPFTIPQLVATSPCRSSDGILYTGKKKDAWFKLDPSTGMKQQVIGWDTSIPTCPVESTTFVYIGRTKYSVAMVDGKKPEAQWNVTFFDYTSRPMTKEEMGKFEVALFASSSTGKTIALDRRRGQLLWELDFQSPVIGAYLLEAEGLINVPYTTLANHTISYLAEYSNDDTVVQSNRMKLYPTLYIGQHDRGLYALPSLVDQNVVTITASDAGKLLLTGPNAPDTLSPYPDFPLPGHDYQLPPHMYQGEFQSVPGLENHVSILTGHYNVPKYADSRFNLPGRSEPVRLLSDSSGDDDKSVQNESTRKETEQTPPTGLWDRFGVYKERMANWFKRQENKGLQLTVIVLCGCLVAMFFYLQVQVREIQNLSQNGSKTSQNSSVGRNGAITAQSVEMPDGMVKIGKITFHPDELLGKGCEGTFVYKGEFDRRRVAVKRLLPDCFTFADREVNLLRESDAHPNVVRYYCMEQDRMFRYIALELCQATLTDYIKGGYRTIPITPMEILKQATEGLAHLHSLDIVHRDIKPHNVLISMTDNNGNVKAMISDFGLCKKLQVGKVSFSRRSGVTGTDGWIAPEMLHGNERTTCAVDLFSLGCLFYYVLSEGEHPFGDSLRRQANILSGAWSLSGLKGHDWSVNLQEPLIRALISEKPEERPSCAAILSYPIFWNSAKILSFFQDVSDRVDVLDEGDPILLKLETDVDSIVRVDWRVHVHLEVVKDLKKYRAYRGDSVRDLLRALRNKKHHYRELVNEARQYLGEIPNEFAAYWLERFPLLLVHTYVMMQCVSFENTFSNYYSARHRYSVSSFRAQVANYAKQHPVVITADDFERVAETTAGWSPQKREARPVSGGLYRNLSKRPNKKKSAVKRDEPIVWAIGDTSK